jgi:uncharacterized membrane protein YgcG
MARLEEKLTAKIEASAALRALPQPSKEAKAPSVGPGLLSSLITASGHPGADADADADANAAIADADTEPSTPTADADADESTHNAASKKAAAAAGVDLSRPIGQLLWSEEIAMYGSAMAFVRMNTFKEARNRHECEAIALSLDAMKRSQIPVTNLSFEIQVRRLLGVRLADEYKDWSFAEALAWKSGHGVQHRGLLRSLLKDRKNFADLKKPASATAAQSFRGARSGGGGGGSGGRGRKPYRGGGRGGKYFSGGAGRSGGHFNSNSNSKPSPAGSGAAGN